jgi:hypothetical protein
MQSMNFSGVLEQYPGPLQDPQYEWCINTDIYEILQAATVADSSSQTNVSTTLTVVLNPSGMGSELALKKHLMRIDKTMMTRMWSSLLKQTEILALPPTPEFSRLVKVMLHAAGQPTKRVGTHLFRRGRAVGLLHGSADAPTVSLALRHRSARSTDAYVLEAAPYRARERDARCRSRQAGRLRGHHPRRSAS